MAVLNSALKAAAAAISRANYLLITAGAGMSADSGLVTVQSNEEFWAHFPKVKKLGLSFAECASEKYLKEDPSFSWAFGGYVYNAFKRANPHQGYHILRKWARAAKYGHFVYTSNIDGLFQKAGFDASRIVECHGSIHYLQCAANCRGDIWPMPSHDIDVDEAEFRARDPLPSCPHCRGLARFNSLMFEDFGWVPSRTEEQHGRLEQSVSAAEQHPDCFKVIIELGAGSVFSHVQHYSGIQQLYTNSLLIRVNLEQDEAFQQGKMIYLPMKALEALIKIDQLMIGHA